VEKSVDEIRHALRRLRRTPGFTAAAMITLALGIGANALVFSVVNAVFLRPLSYQDADRLVWATEFLPKLNRSVVLTPEYAAWKRESTVLERVEAMGSTLGTNLTRPGRPAERVQVAHVTPGFFAMIGILPRIGTGFDAGATSVDPPTAILSDDFWRGSMHADPAIVGKSITLNGKPLTIRGVLPHGFIYPDGDDVALWLPDAVPPSASVPSRATQVVRVIGKTKHGVALEQVRVELERIARGMDHQYPAPWADYHAAAKVGVASLQRQLTAGTQMTLMPSSGSAPATAILLMGAVGFLLLIACANVANLFLARALTRRKEIATRFAIGASRWDIGLMLLTESLLLGGLGGLLGLAFLFWGRGAVGFLMPKPLGSAIPIDWRVLLFTAGCTLASGMIFGWIPALRASRTELNPGMKDIATRSGGRLQAFLSAARIALSIMLLAGAGLMIRSVLLLASTNPGFDVRNVLMATVMLRPIQMYGPEQQVEFFDRMLAGVEKLPGVRFAAVTSSPPMAQFSAIGVGLRADNGPPIDDTVSESSVSANYFETLGIPLIAGRFFDSGDASGRPQVAILNQAMARLFFPGRNPIGHRIGANATVIGVVADTRHRALDDKVWPEMFLPFAQSPSPWITVLVRGAADPSGLASPVRGVARSIDASQPLFDVELLERRVAGTLAERRERAAMLGAFAVLALLIAVVGIYGVMSYSVAQRTREIGLRMALGAGRFNVLRMIVGAGLRVAAFGILLGLAGALLVTRVLRTFLFGVTPTDRITFCLVCGIVAAASFLASYLPARRAASVDPMTVLRLE
jgi:putative ABC transport system permease protein